MAGIDDEARMAATVKVGAGVTAAVVGGTSVDDTIVGAGTAVDDVVVTDGIAGNTNTSGFVVEVAG